MSVQMPRFAAKVVAAFVVWCIVFLGLGFAAYWVMSP